MVGEPFNVLAQPVLIEAFDGADDPGIEVAAPVVEEAPVGHLMRERVLEGVLEVGEQARLVKKLGRLKVTQPATERLLVLVRDRLEEGKGEVLPDDRGSLEEPFLLEGQAVDARGQNRLYRAGHEAPRQAVRSW